jgi:hypothetical protein
VNGRCELPHRHRASRRSGPRRTREARRPDPPKIN